MADEDNNAAPLPYSDIAAAVLEVIYDSLFIIYEGRFNNVEQDIIIQRLVASAEALNDEKWAKNKSNNNSHVLQDIPKPRSGPSAERWYDTGLKVPRISRLCLEASNLSYKHAQDTEGRSPRGIFVPSPLAILVDALTTPFRPESYSYGFALARSILFSYFKTYPATTNVPEGWTSMSIADVQDNIESFTIYVLHRDNIHHSKTNKAKAFLAHFLAMNGTLVLRFGTAGKETVKTTKAQSDCLAFLRGQQFLSPEANSRSDYEFRLSPGLQDIPDTQEILNSLTGVPLPIAGGSTVFFGGLQQSHRDSLVISISGSPGTGKTSLALALAASLAPFGTRCFYWTFEEDAETLKRRALGLVPQYFRRTTLLDATETDWLVPLALDSTIIKNVKVFAEEYIKPYLAPSDPPEDRGDATVTSLPGIAPFLFVVDSLTTLLGNHDSDHIDDFCSFIGHLRELHCIVLLLSADDIPKSSRLEFLVDSVISLKHEGTHKADTKPFRLFQLNKSRLQMSRPGSHILHLSGERGLRISPQIPSQLDSHKIHKSPLPDTAAVLDTLKPEGAIPPSQAQDRLINLHPKSRILIHGHGSSGKAQVALKILMARNADIATGKIAPSPTYKRPRILVISFLYPGEYYVKIFNRLQRMVNRNTYTDNPPDMYVLALTPGFIGPEDFISMVLLEMDRGHFEGWPYTGVLLDGLHNTFLQFPLLQANPMVWPALYSLLSRYDLTIITTFTTFAKTTPGSGHSKDDEVLILQGQLPFLHVLVQGTDFHLNVGPRNLVQHDRNFLVTVKSAYGQHLPSRALVWDADEWVFRQFESLPSLQQELPLTNK